MLLVGSMMLQRMVRRLVRVGQLTVVFAGGPAETFGDGTGPQIGVRITPRGLRLIARDPDVGLGEAYMDGDLVVEQGSLWDLLKLIGRNLPDRMGNKPSLLWRVWSYLDRVWHQSNDRSASRRNVAHHYDLSTEVYRRFLDSDLQYSCAYYVHESMGLEDAQAAKKAHIAQKLLIHPGQTILDIGCGWGGMALTLAGQYGARVTGVTLSTEQLKVAQQKADASGLADRAQFSLKDYRDVDAQFDRVVSVGMLEHVGAPHLVEFFAKVRELLTDDGVAVIHSIGRADGPGITQEWIQKYVFPGGYIPALSEVTRAVEEAGLWITDIEVLRLHYAETLKAWRERFLAQWQSVAELYDERFCRMWEFYLALSEFGFRYRYQMNFQIQLTKRVDALPITRDYMQDPPPPGEDGPGRDKG